MRLAAAPLMAALFVAFIATTGDLHSQSTSSQPPAGAASAGTIKVIFDTDFLVPPQDDGLALALALKSPELKILGITTVAGNGEIHKETADALRELEIAGRTDIPVYMGAVRPLVHEKTDWDTTVHGKWWSNEAPAPPPGGFAKIEAQKGSAVDFIVRTVNESPGQITIIAIGPLSNIAMAIRQDPTFAKNVKQINIMGGSIGMLDGGAGNVTPNAEFNFWVDPEAAQVVLRSGIPVNLTPLNVTRKTDFSNDYLKQIVAVDNPITNLIKERMNQMNGRSSAGSPAPNPGVARGGRQMFDELTVATVIDPTLVKSRSLFVDMDINRGPDYGVSVGGARPWEGGEDAKSVSVQYDVDNDRFMEMFVKRLTAK
jgi:inosine-uridine nucleoside N-ribohydrolase